MYSTSVEPAAMFVVCRRNEPRRTPRGGSDRPVDEPRGPALVPDHGGQCPRLHTSIAPKVDRARHYRTVIIVSDSKARTTSLRRPSTTSGEASVNGAQGAEADSGHVGDGVEAVTRDVADRQSSWSSGARPRHTSRRRPRHSSLRRRSARR